MRKQFLIAAIICFVLFGLTLNYGWGYTETFYVCQGGDGTLPETDACSTAWDAEDVNTGGNWAATNTDDTKIGPNDIVYVKDDGGNITYGAGNGVFDAQNSGLSGEPITFKNYPGDTPVLDGGSARLSGMIIYQRSYITLDGLTIQNGATYGVYAVGAQNGIVIQNCTIEGDSIGVQYYNNSASDQAGMNFIDNNVTGTGDWGITIYSDNGGDIQSPIITGNTVASGAGATSGAIGVVGGGGSSITGTLTITGNTITSAGGYGVFVDVEGGGSVTATTAISNNTITNWSQTTGDRAGIHLIGFANNTVIVENNVLTGGGTQYDSAGIYMDGGAGWTSVTAHVRYNYIHDIEGFGVLMYLADSVKVYNNIIENTCNDDSNALRGQIVILSGAADTANTNEIYNNTIYLDVNTENVYGIQIVANGGSVAGNIIKNNIIYHDAAAGYDYIYNGADATADIDYNLYWPVIGNTEMHYNGTDYNSFSLWQAASHDANGVEADPLFSDAANGDFTLQSGSPAIDAGALLSIHVDGWTDYAGIARLYGTGVDIGAYEVVQYKGSFPLFFPWLSIPAIYPWYVAP